MPHTCSTLVVHCIDFRIQQALREFLREENLLGDADIVAIAGGVQELVQNQKPKTSFLLQQILLSHKLHGIQKVYLINHTDCGAYGGAAAFAGAAAERAFHEAELRKAKEIVCQRLPEATVRLGLAVLEQGNAPSSVRMETIPETGTKW